MSVAEQWKRIGSELPDGWARVDLHLQLPSRDAANDAAAALAPAGPFRAAPTVIRFASPATAAVSAPTTPRAFFPASHAAA